MKKIFLLFIICSFGLLAKLQSQEKPGEAFYVMDENFKGTTLEKARYLMHSVKKNDTCWQFDTYNFWGPMISSEQYNDQKGSTGHGSFRYFTKKGEVDSSGKFTNGYQDGSWDFFDSKGRHYLEKRYKAGTVIETKDIIKLDSMEKAKKDTTSQKIKHIEIESDFPGGVKAWINYLEKNLKYPDRAEKSAIQGTVVIQFIVDTEGHVIDPEIVKSVEYSLDQEALRLIEKSPVWSVAIQDGRKVKSYKKQPITFRLQ